MAFFNQSHRPVQLIGADEEPTFQRIRPAQPTDRKAAGLSVRLIESLLLKTVKQEGAVTEQQVSACLCLPPGCFRSELQSLFQRQCLDMAAPGEFDLTTRGRDLAHYYEEEDAYVGPAPVSFAAYCEMVRRQAGRGRRLTQEEFARRFAHMPAPLAMRQLLREAFNSGQVMILWGPPGNGKSLWSEGLHALLTDPVILPHAFEFNNKVVQYYDGAFHQTLPELMRKEEEQFAHTVALAEKPDRRWLICRPPLVTVSTEFRVEQMAIPFDGRYNAPPHLKANNGIFIFDDLGRQTQDHNVILNQFITPLEQQEAIIRFAGGSAIRAPYKQRLILSTNLDCRAIIDDAFARRLLYQVLVDRPTDENWKRILCDVARSHGVTDEALLVELSRKLLYWFRRDGRAVRAVDPRNLFRMLDASLDEGETLARKLDLDLWERVYRQYPPAYEREATGYTIAEATPEQFRAAFASLAREHALDAVLAAALAEMSLGHFQGQGRFLRPSDAGSLFALADGVRPAGESIAAYATEETWRALLSEYPNFTPEDAQRMRRTR